MNERYNIFLVQLSRPTKTPLLRPQYVASICTKPEPDICGCSQSIVMLRSLRLMEEGLASNVAASSDIVCLLSWYNFHISRSLEGCCCGTYNHNQHICTSELLYVCHILLYVLNHIPDICSCAFCLFLRFWISQQVSIYIGCSYVTPRNLTYREVTLLDFGSECFESLKPPAFIAD